MSVVAKDKLAFPVIIGVLGDSLPLPRQFQELEFYQTYPYLLANWLRTCGTHTEVWEAAQAGVPITNVIHNYEDYRTYVGRHTQGIGILHLGIVDCTPRPVPLGLRKTIGKLPTALRKPIIKVLHDYRVQILKYGPEFVFTKPQQFRRKYRYLLEQMTQDFGQVYAVNIIPPGPNFESRSPGVAQNAKAYNRIISEVTDSVEGATIIHIWQACQQPGGIETLVSGHDGHHLNPAGHHRVFQMVASACEEKLMTSSAMSAGH